MTPTDGTIEGDIPDPSATAPSSSESVVPPSPLARPTPSLVEQQARWWLWLVPAWLRATRGEEIVATIVDLVPPGATRLPWKLHRDLIRAGLGARRRGTPPWDVLLRVITLDLRAVTAGRVPDEWRPWLAAWLSTAGWRRGYWLLRAAFFALLFALAVSMLPNEPVWLLWFWFFMPAAFTPRVPESQPPNHPRLPFARAIAERDAGWRQSVWHRNGLDDPSVPAPSPVRRRTFPIMAIAPNVSALAVLVPALLWSFASAIVLTARTQGLAPRPASLALVGMLAPPLLAMFIALSAAAALVTGTTQPTPRTRPRRSTRWAWAISVVVFHVALAGIVAIARHPTAGQITAIWTLPTLELVLVALVLRATSRLHRTVRLWDVWPSQTAAAADEQPITQRTARPPSSS